METMATKTGLDAAQSAALRSAAAKDLGLRDSAAAGVRHDWTRAEVEEIYRMALPELVFRAQTVHRGHHATDRVQTCQLISIKTGGCPEDCAYCPQSAHYDAGVERQGLLDPQHVIEVAREAAGRGVTRFCMGAAWRDAPEGREFENVLEMVRGVSALGMEVCCTLGMLTEAQAARLKEAGLTAYNHNLDTSPEFYGSIITTRVYDDRLKTLAAGRKQLSAEAVTLCFLAGANSIFVGEKLLTTPNPGPDEDEQLLQTLGMKPLEPHAAD